jgi:hypothetical protein
MMKTSILAAESENLLSAVTGYPRIAGKARRFEAANATKVRAPDRTACILRGIPQFVQPLTGLNWNASVYSSVRGT